MVEESTPAAFQQLAQQDTALAATRRRLADEEATTVIPRTALVELSLELQQTTEELADSTGGRPAADRTTERLQRAAVVEPTVLDRGNPEPWVRPTWTRGHTQVVLIGQRRWSSTISRMPSAACSYVSPVTRARLPMMPSVTTAVSVEGYTCMSAERAGCVRAWYYDYVFVNLSISTAERRWRR